jgi:hypothetical protein
VIDDLKPLPKCVRWWRETRNRRVKAWQTLKTLAAKAIILAITALGAILISYGVHQVYAPAGFVIGGAMCWLLLWSHEQDQRRNR